MSLQRYKQKRDFTITPEPAGKMERAGKQLRFVIQKHAARRLHYDFRLELDGTLKSWAVPKGPSLDPADKRLAVHVEDHPMSYGNFEGVIPEKQYGAGQVIVWDHGWWQPIGDARAGYRKGNLKFELAGEKLQGHWALVRMHGRPDEKADNWLLIQENDETALPGEGEKVVQEQPQSVLSGRTIDDIKEGRRAAASLPTPRKKKAAEKKPETSAKLAAGTRSAFPEQVEAQLATLVDKAPAGEWAYEVKFDGYRLLCRLNGKKVALFTRNQNDWTASFPEIAAALRRLPVKNAWLDGEACVMDDKGLSRFGKLQQYLAGESKAAPILMVFDVLFLDGRDLRELPLEQRKEILKQLLAGQPDESPLRYSDHLVSTGSEAQVQACKIGLEGLIGKRLGSVYSGRRTQDWIKLKCRQRQEFVIGGYTPPGGSRTGFGSLLLGVHDKDGSLRYAGRVGTGFNENSLRNMLERMQAVASDISPFAEVPRDQRVRGTQWLKPTLVAEITFAELTEDGLVRQGVFEGLREDKPAQAIGIEKPQAVATRAAPKKLPAKPKPQASKAGEIRISHPERIVYTEDGITKLDIVNYLEFMAERLLPYIADRPLSLVRCPGGAASACFFQKHADEKEIQGVEIVTIEDSHGPMPYMVANTADALRGLAQMNTLELHAWNAKAGDIERPDMFVIDLDPDAGLAWEHVTEAAALVRKLLDHLGLESFLKTTGGKGLHAVVPIVPQRDWDEVKEFTRMIALRLVEAFPDRFTANVSKARRKGKIFIDYLRNGRGSTSIAPFSLRARPGATVAVPVPWEFLESDMQSSSFTLRNVEALLKKRKDPWADYFSLKQKLSEKMLRSVGM